MSRFSLEARFTADASRFNRTIAAMETRFGQLTRTLASGFSRANAVIGSVHGALKNVAIAAGGAAIPLGFIAKNVIDTGANFEAALSNVAAVSGATGAELDKLKNKAMELGSTTKFTGTEVAGAMEAMVKAGFKVDETLAGVGGILSAAAADGATIEDTATAIMASMKGLGLGPEKMQSFADMLAKAGDTTAASIGTITESMAKFGPVARQLGIPVESAIAQLALLQDAGLDASTAGTSLASVYSKLAAPMGTTEKALKSLGIKVKDVHGNMKLPPELMAEIVRATDGIEGNVGKMEAITQLVGLESQKALLNISAAAREGKLDQLTKDLQSAAGYADLIAAKKLDNFKGDVTKLGAAVDALKVKLFDTQKGPLRDITQGMTAWVTANEGLITSKVVETVEDFRRNLPEIVIWTKRIGVGIGVFYGVAAAMKAAAIATTAFSVAGKVAAFTGKVLTSQTVASTAATVASTAATGVSTAATWVKVGASKALNGALILGQLATTRITAATIANTATNATNTAATWARNAASVAQNATTRAGTAISAAYAAVTSRLTLKTIADTAATVVRKIAQWALNTATTAGSGAMGIYAIATGRAAAATAAGTPALLAGAGAMKAMAVSAGAAGAAIGAVMLAWDQASKFEEENGMGLGDLVGEMWDRGEIDPFAAYDAHMNEKAVRKAKERGAPKVTPPVLGPSERAAADLIESKSTHTEQAEITIKTPPGTKAEVTKTPRGRTRLRVQPSGAF